MAKVADVIHLFNPGIITKSNMYHTFEIGKALQ